MGIVFDPKSEASKKDVPKLRALLLNENTEIFYKASPDLINLIMADNDPRVKALPAKFKEVLLQELGLRIQKKMMLNWIEGNLDENNAFMLANGEISLVQDKDVKL